MKAPVLAPSKQCTGCGACAAACKFSALSLRMLSDGHFYPTVNADECVGCLQCEMVCPIQSSFEYGCNSMLSFPQKAWNKDDGQRMRSSSGGVFSALAFQFIKEGGYVSGAVIEGLSIKHIVSSNAEDIIRMQGSKYLQSETTEAFKQIMELLPVHRVLFSGTGCQVAGLLCLVNRKSPKLLDNLFCVDIVCDGVPSYKLLEKTVESLHSKDVSLVSFRNKAKGWSHTPKELTLCVNGQEKNLGSANLMIKGFNKALTSRYSCYDCKYAFTDRRSDVTIADFWGLENETEDNLLKGVSMVIVHSDKGKQMMADANIQYSRVDWSMAVSKNFRLYQGEKYGFTDTWLRRNLSLLFSHFSYKTLMSIYAASPTSQFDIIGRIVGVWYKMKNEKMKREISNNVII